MCTALLLALAACGGRDGGTGPTGGNTPRTPVPTELVGQWFNGNSSSSNYYNPSSGSFQNAYGDGLYFRITSDGHFEKAAQLYTFMYGCGFRAQFYTAGTVAVDEAGRTITMYPTRNTSKHVEDSCNSGNDEDSEFREDPRTYAWEFGTDQYGTWFLFLTNEDGLVYSMRPD